MQFRTRSFEKEFLDNKNIAEEDLFRNLKELDIINKLLGGYRVTVKSLKKVIRTGRSFHSILDIGFGGGDSIRQLANFAKQRNIQIFLHGVDYKPECLAYAEKNLAGINNKKLHCIDYRQIPPGFFDSIDIIHCSLFLHHLNEAEIVRLFRIALLHDCTLVINDLHRNWFAYYAIRMLTTFFSKSWLVKNDAPVSVKRGFSRKELEELLSLAGFTHYEIKWCWAFRYLVIAYS